MKQMFKTMMNGKIHRATVTQADLNYVGSITIDEDIMDAVGIEANEKVAIVNNNTVHALKHTLLKGLAVQVLCA